MDKLDSKPEEVVDEKNSPPVDVQVHEEQDIVSQKPVEQNVVSQIEYPCKYCGKVYLKPKSRSSHEGKCALNPKMIAKAAPKPEEVVVSSTTDKELKIIEDPLEEPDEEDLKFGKLALNENDHEDDEDGDDGNEADDDDVVPVSNIHTQAEMDVKEKSRISGEVHTIANDMDYTLTSRDEMRLYSNPDEVLKDMKLCQKHVKHLREMGDKTTPASDIYGMSDEEFNEFINDKQQEVAKKLDDLNIKFDIGTMYAFSVGSIIDAFSHATSKYTGIETQHTSDKLLQEHDRLQLILTDLLKEYPNVVAYATPGIQLAILTMTCAVKQYQPSHLESSI